MGGLPLHALVTLGLPPDTEMDDLKKLYRGMLEVGNKYGVAIVGGDAVRSPVVFITVSLIGVHPGQPMLRSTARPGDLVAVTGYLGASGGGLRLMRDPHPIPAEAADYLRRSHRRPEPAVPEGRVLAAAGVVTAIDISDGLADDLAKLCRASGISARLFADRIPVHPLLKQAFPRPVPGAVPQRRRGLSAAVHRRRGAHGPGNAPPARCGCGGWGGNPRETLARWSSSTHQGWKRWPTMVVGTTLGSPWIPHCISVPTTRNRPRRWEESLASKPGMGTSSC